MALDIKLFTGCLDEIDRCLFNAAAHETAGGFIGIHSSQRS